MTSFRNLKIRWKIILPYTLLIFLTVGLGLSWYSLSEAKQLETQQLNKVEILIRGLAEASSQPLAIREYNRLQELLVNLKEIDSDIQYAILVNNEGRVLASTDDALLGTSLNLSGSESASLLRSEAVYVETTENEADYELRHPVKLFDIVMGELRVGVSRARINMEIRQFILSNVGMGFIMMLSGVVVFNWIILIGVLNPIKELSQASLELSSGHLNKTVDYSSQDEIGQLAFCFNRMAHQLRESFATLEQRVADRTAELSQANVTLKEQIEERKRAEQALKQSKEFAETVLNSMSDAISIIDVNTFEIVGANTAFINEIGHSMDQIIGKTCYAITHHRAEPCAPPDDVCPLLDTRITKKSATAEHIHYKRDGEKVFVEIAVSPIEDADGKVTQVVHIARNITERKRAEELLKTYTAKLEQSNRELVEFAYVASHDLQEPLRKVTAFGSRLQVKYGDKLGEKGGDYLNRMLNATERMQALINGLLDYSRVTTKAQPFELIDLSQIAAEVLSDLEMRLQDVNGRVEINDLPTIQADPLQMRQLMQNLLSNALKFNKPDEPPVVKVSTRHLNGQADQPAGAGVKPEFYEISVSDNGIGFDEKYADRIFGVFQRLHGRFEYEGTGIGLAICKKIAERHGGTIEAHSSPGQGATFVITLPAVQLIGEAIS